MTQPLTPAQEAAAYYQANMQSPNVPAPVPVPAPPPPPAPPTVSQLEDARRHGHISYQQYLQALPTARPDAPPPPAPVLSPAQQLEDDRAHGRISFQQYQALKANPNAYVNPNAGKPPVDIGRGTPQPAAAPPAVPKERLVTAQPGAAPGTDQGAASALEPAAAQALQGLLAPRGASGGPAHAVGLSPADKAEKASLQEQGALEALNSGQTANTVQSVADTYKNQMDALAAESKQGALDYQNHLNDLADRRKQLDTDAQQAQKRIEGELANVEATGTDPNRYFHNQTTGQNILGALLVGLGGFGAHALGPGGHDSANTALEIMNSGIQREVDAQKTDLQKRLNVLGQRMNLNAQGFDQQKALLESERESIQTSYQIAINETAKRAAQFKDNADVQSNAAKIIGGLRDAGAERVGQINGQIYQLDKGAEKIVGGGTGAKDMAAWVRNRTKELVDKGAAAGHVVSAEDAAVEAVKEYGQVNLKPGASALDISSPQKNGPNSPMSPRLVKHVSELEAQIKDIDALEQKIKSGTGFSPSDRKDAEVLSENVRKAGHESVNAHPLDITSNTHATLSQLATLRQSVQRQLDTVKSYAHGGGGGEDSDNPAGGEKVDDEQ